jgi:aminodeoxyfutalosine deaminase
VSEVPAGGGSIAARFVAVAADAPLRPAEIVWDRTGTIVRLGRPRGPVADVCVLPGLVNAHAHLQLAPLARPVRAFRRWIDAVMASQAATSAAARRDQRRRGVRSLLASGTTAVGEIDSTGDSLAELARIPLRSRCYRELTGYHLDAAAAQELVRERTAASRAFAARATGLSPHAPYSVSPALFRAAAARTKHLSIHCAEVPEEQQFLHTGRGPFAELLQRLGRLPPAHRPPAMGAVAWLQHLRVLTGHTLLVHCQELERGDVARIAAAGAAIVVCPGTIAWFRRDPPPVATWLAAGIPVALGTDSLASNRELSVRAELQLAARTWPALAPRQLLAMATAAGARALGLPGLGRLRRGGRADFVVVAAAGEAEANVAAFVHGESRLAAVVVAGKHLRPGALPASR